MKRRMRNSVEDGEEGKRRDDAEVGDEDAAPSSSPTFLV